MANARHKMPAVLQARAEAAIERHKSKSWGNPGMELSGGWRDWSFGNPYRDEDLDRWQALLFEAFGTSSQSVVGVFLDQLANLVPAKYDSEAQEWQPSLDQLNAAVAIVASVRPENEAQSALAAQMVALHFTSMGLARRISEQAAPDERTAATLARVSKAYADLCRTLARLQGKLQPHEYRQTINVIYTYNRDQRSINLEGGYREFGGQAYGANGGAAVPCTAMPSQSQMVAGTMPLPGGESEAGLPRAWWGKRVWRAFWQG